VWPVLIFVQGNWSTLIGEHQSDVLEWVACINMSQLVLCYLQDVKVSPCVEGRWPGRMCAAFQWVIVVHYH